MRATRQHSHALEKLVSWASMVVGERSASMFTNVGAQSAGYWAARGHDVGLGDARCGGTSVHDLSTRLCNPVVDAYLRVWRDCALDNERGKQ